jgi:phosphoglycolate phosphatase
MANAPLVVFDLDGTLVDTAPDLIGALNVILAKDGIPELPLATARNLIGGGARKLIERGLEVAGRDCTVAEIDRMMKDFIAYYADHIADMSQPFEGLEQALDDLAAKGAAFAVCTNKLEWLSKLLMDRLNLSRRFAAICGADTFGIAKPDPSFLRQTVARAGGNMASTIMVGDAGPDVGVARRASVPVIGVTFGYTETPIEELKPDRVISRMSELPQAVKDLLAQMRTSASSI